MNLQELSAEISRSFIEAYYPEQSDTFDEYINALSAEVGEEAPIAPSDRFGPGEVVGAVVISIIFGVVSNFLYDLLRPKFRQWRKPQRLDVKPESMVSTIRASTRRIKTIERQLAGRTKQAHLVEQVISHSLVYIEKRYGKSKSGNA